ncbi:MAG: hypothetical protein IJ496_06615 [Ruminococcus sp.]|nr:hypothetical protein [Ruminococcus sp.]
MCDYKIIKICTTFTSLFIAVFICIMSIIHFRENESEEKVIEAVYAGEVVDKRIENARQGLFSSSDIQYRIYIEFEYTHDDETQTGEKYFTVDKETYLAYDIGDWFDSHDFEYVDVEEG